MSNGPNRARGDARVPPPPDRPFAKAGGGIPAGKGTPPKSAGVLPKPKDVHSAPKGGRR